MFEPRWQLNEQKLRAHPDSNLIRHNIKVQLSILQSLIKYSFVLQFVFQLYKCSSLDITWMNEPRALPDFCFIKRNLVCLIGCVVVWRNRPTQAPRADLTARVVHLVPPPQQQVLPRTCVMSQNVSPHDNEKPTQQYRYFQNRKKHFQFDSYLLFSPQVWLPYLKHEGRPYHYLSCATHPFCTCQEGRAHVNTALDLRFTSHARYFSPLGVFTRRLNLNYN